MAQLAKLWTSVNPCSSIGTDTDYFCDRFDILTSGEKFVIGRYPFNCSDYLYNKAKGWCFKNFGRSWTAPCFVRSERFAEA